jgi:DNA-binding NarL/FixJ family response regulator
MTAALAPRTLRVIEHLAAGVGRPATGARLGISLKTVAREFDCACRELRVRRNDRAALVNASLRERVITLPEQPPIELDEYLVDTLELIADGYTNAEIAAELWLSVDAVKSRVKRIFRELGAEGRAHAVAIGWQRGLLGRDWAVARASA